MSDRLTQITTRGGDDGSTGLGDGSRVGKDSVRIHALGEVDELNSSIGVALAEPLPPALRDALVRVQNDLFDLGGELCIPGREALTEAQLARLEACVEAFNGELEPLREFILPGGSRAAAALHVARCVCRRAERAVVALDKAEVIPATSIKYLNRLSDLLFIGSRIANRFAGQPDVLWQPGLNA
ncbi:cob(I)yrinic acid a,c-diamide adenosyltransferase [Jeongeupia naejangsanensis]|uniref:Cobalamin adenosyltransferase n=1 Tax=Jeongeupia naejangsanensis TaxID=613195 RepID=A0ABS2BIQ1_9NEIS|nr:cob(I)yrinic acid a,c-diamide adenosyltransferase [Jeongeupia naejangsanensis]MBM3115472.1 cob(I)yrinic acid a,c-diamide adenosyltransferase [Jeongeupia naejangsanensis]